MISENPPRQPATRFFFLPLQQRTEIRNAARIEELDLGDSFRVQNPDLSNNALTAAHLDVRVYTRLKACFLLTKNDSDDFPEIATEIYSILRSAPAALCITR